MDKYIHSLYCIGGSDQDLPQENEMQNEKMAIWGSLTNSWEKKRSKRQREKEILAQLNAEFQRLARRYKKAFLSEQCKEIQNNWMGKTKSLQEN